MRFYLMSLVGVGHEYNFGISPYIIGKRKCLT